MINQDLFRKVIAQGKQIHWELQTEMDETDTKMWHDESKYYNADLNTLGVLIRVFYREAEAILKETLEEEGLDYV